MKKVMPPFQMSDFRGTNQWALGLVGDWRLSHWLFGSGLLTNQINLIIKKCLLKVPSFLYFNLILLCLDVLSFEVIICPDIYRHVCYPGNTKLIILLNSYFWDSPISILTSPVSVNSVRPMINFSKAVTLRTTLMLNPFTCSLQDCDHPCKSLLCILCGGGLKAFFEKKSSLNAG